MTKQQEAKRLHARKRIEVQVNRVLNALRELRCDGAELDGGSRSAQPCEPLRHVGGLSLDLRAVARPDTFNGDFDRRKLGDGGGLLSHVLSVSHGATPCQVVPEL